MFRKTLAGIAFIGVLIWITPSQASGASKEIQELQRDMAQLQEQMRQLQQSQDKQLTELRSLVQQSLTSAQDASRAVSAVQSGLQTNLREQESKVVTPVVGLGTRMDQMSGDVQKLQDAVGNLTSILSKMQAQLTDVSNAVKVIQAPPLAPPSGSGGSALNSTSGSGSTPSTEAPTSSASDLYANASRDRSAGKLDLALQEFTDYLKWYGNTDLAPNAQYYIAWIHASQGDYAAAVQDYDLVLEKYPDNNKTPDAIYGKGIALTKLGRRTDGAKEFQELLRRFPSNNLSTQACSQLTNMGLKCGSTSTRTSRRK